MPLQYVPPEEAFEVRIQCTDEQVPVYHTYANGRITERRNYWYTFDEAEDEDNEFDIRELPTFSLKSLSHQDLLQGCLKRGLVRINNNQLITVGGA